MSRSALRNDTPIRLRAETLVEAIHRAADLDSYLRFVERRGEPVVFPYRDVLHRARGVACYLRDHGLDRGDRVMLMLTTSPAWVYAYFGILIAGAVPVPVGPTFSMGGLDKHTKTLHHILSACGAAFFIGTAQVEPYLDRIVPEGRALEKFVRPEEIESVEPSGKSFQPPRGDDLGLIQFTSGTTTMPKGVELTQHALICNADAIVEGMQVTPGDRGLSWLPLFHDMGLIGALLSCMYCPYPVTLMTPELFLMRPQRWMQLASDLRATITVAPNFAYKMACRKATDAQVASLDLSALRIALSGAEEVHAATIREFSQKFAPCGFREEAFFPVYGMAENCLAATFPGHGERWSSLTLDRERLDADGVAVPSPGGEASSREVVSVGRPVLSQAIRVVGPTGDIVLEQHVGEVMVESPSLMRGYHRNPSATAEAIEEGWLHTGDLGFISDGKLYITGRRKEMIIIRGRNYYPQDIEEIVAEVAGERSGGAAVFSIHDERNATEELVILVEADRKLLAERDTVAKAVNNTCIAAFGIGSERIVFVKNRTLTRTTSGKLQRTKCREQYLRGELFVV